MGDCQAGSGDTISPTDNRPWIHNAAGWPRRSEEAQPRCGVTLDGVKRLKIPSCLERGRHPTDASQVGANPRIPAGSTDGCDWLRLFRWTTVPRGHPLEETGLRMFTRALDIGSHTNATLQARPNSRSEGRAEQLSCLSRGHGMLCARTSSGCHGAWCFTMAFRIVNSLRIQAVSATFAALPAARRRS